MIYLSFLAVVHSYVKLPKVEAKFRFFQQCIPPAKANLSLTWAGRHCIAEALSIRRSHHPFVLAKTRIWELISAEIVHHKRLKHTKRLFQNTVGHSPFHPTNCIYINCRKCVLGIRQTQTTYLSNDWLCVTQSPTQSHNFHPTIPLTHPPKCKWGWNML